MTRFSNKEDECAHIIIAIYSSNLSPSLIESNIEEVRDKFGDTIVDKVLSSYNSLIERLK